jgi:hypothetical protein
MLIPIQWVTGLYGRLDKDGWFPTTVTNMDPTAKQSKVLHPYVRSLLLDYPKQITHALLVQTYRHSPRTGTLSRLSGSLCFSFARQRCSHGQSCLSTQMSVDRLIFVPHT